MRRVLLFAAFLVLLGLTTATAASFDVQAEDITSFSQDVSISVPAPVATGTLYLVDGPPAGSLTTVEPTKTGGNITVHFDRTSDPLETEVDAPRAGNKVDYTSWSTVALPEGLAFTGKKARVHFTRTSAGGTLAVGIFECPPDVRTTTAEGCALLGSGSGVGESIDITSFLRPVAANRHLHLKMVNPDSVGSSVQWGYKEQNRPARLEFLDATAP